jgi:hypothetical protein
MPTPILPIEYVDLWISPTGGIQPAEEYRNIEVPLLGGSSGGGCWKAGVRGSEANWSPDQLLLTGIHVSSSSDNKAEDRFAREVLIGYHLRLIADDLDQVSDNIYNRWPELQTHIGLSSIR